MLQAGGLAPDLRLQAVHGIDGGPVEGQRDTLLDVAADVRRKLLVQLGGGNWTWETRTWTKTSGWSGAWLN